MKYKITILFSSILISLDLISSAVLANEVEGMIKISSQHSVSATIDKLESSLKAKGMTIFKRVNHASGAKNAGMTLRPTELLIFGNPKVGTPLMLCSQTAALDLPQKALAYEDINGQVWLAYNKPAYMAKRHNIKGCDKQVQKVSNALAAFAKVATE